MTGAAFFDLDRTLLPHASGTIFAKHLEAEGILSKASSVPGADLMVKAYDVFGETKLNMRLAKLAVRAAKGWSVAAVEQAAKNAVPDLVDAIGGYGKVIIDQHRAAGDKLVIASTSPVVLMAPLADALGFDAVIGTEWQSEGGVFIGKAEGEFVWGPKKREAIKAWAHNNGVSLAESTAYTDSYYDTPMLTAVGTAVAVNPDARLAGVAALQGWEIRYFDAPPGVLKVAGFEMQDWMRSLTRPEMAPNAKWQFSGVENVPKEGAAILTFNHRSYFDVMAMQQLFALVDRPSRFLGKAELFDNPVVGPIARLAGGIRVDRGSGSAKPLEKASEALRAGEVVSLAPQGTIPRGQQFYDPVLVGRPGAAQLAKDAGKVPVIPVALWGTEAVWPRNEKVPHFNLVSPPTVSVTVGEPVDLKYRSAKTDTVRIMDAISALLPEDAKSQIEPTKAQLEKTFPAGYEMTEDDLRLPSGELAS